MEPDSDATRFEQGRPMSLASGVRLLLLGAIWGASFLFQKVAVPAFGPAALIEVRLALAALFLGAVAVATGRALDWGTNGRHHVVIGGINSALPFLLFAYAAQTLPASLLALFNSLAPIFGAVIAAVWLKTPVTRTTAMGLACGVAGVGVLTFDHLIQSRAAAPLAATVGALGAAVLAPVCYGAAATYIKWASAKIDPFANAHGAMWAAAAIALPLAIVSPPSAIPDAPAVAAVVVLGLVCTGAAYLLQFRLFADLGPAGGLTVAFLIPVFGVLWGALFLGEPVGWTLVCGGALILAGTALVTGVIDPSRIRRRAS